MLHFGPQDKQQGLGNAFFFLGREEAVTVSTRKLDDCDLNKAAIGTDYLQHMTATIRKMIRRAPVSDGSV